VLPEIVGGRCQHRGVTHTEVSPAETLPPLALTPEQAAAVAGALAVMPYGPYSGHGLAALQKVLAVLEPDPDRRTTLMASSLWAGVEANQSTEVRAAVERAVVQRRVLVIRYRDGKGAPTQREVEPQLLARSSEHWFLVAWCRERQAPRWFRVDRVLSAALTEETAPRRDPALFGAPSSTHPAGKGLDRPAGPERHHRNLRVLPGGRQ
jgi:predicted DNA-binding transcriptional regulator YafY